MTLALLLGGCGDGLPEDAEQIETNRPQASAQIRTEGDGEESRVVSGTGFIIFGDDGSPPPAIEEVYAAFTRAPTPRDKQASAMAERWFLFDDLHASIGRVRAGEGRVLLDGLGGDEDILFAAPTSEAGNICFGLLPNGGGSCGIPGPGGLDLAWSHADEYLIVYGLIGNDITSVDIVLRDRAYSARIGKNAFALRLPHRDPAELRGIVIRDRHGESETIDFAGPLSTAVSHLGPPPDEPIDKP
jgi:hypothetical protein